MKYNPVNIFFRNRKLQFYILIEFFILLLTTSFSIIWYTYENNSQSVLKFSDELISQISQASIDRISTKLDQTQTVATLSTSLIDTVEDINVENSKVVNFMIESLESFPYLDNLYISSESGQFVQVRRLPPKSRYRSFARLLPGAAKFAIRFVDRRSGGPVETWFYKDDERRIVEEEKLANSMYDHRLRVWYVGARQSLSLYWSDIYIFNTTKMPGLTASMPLLGNDSFFIGVIGVDISMSSLSGLLKASQIGDEAVAFVVNEKGELIAHNDMDQVITVDGDEVKAALIDDIEDKRLSNAFRIFRNDDNRRFTFSHNNVEYVATFTPFPKGFHKDWYIGLVVPMEVFVGDVNKTQRETFIISIIFLILSTIMVILLSRRFSRPIVQLAQEANNIRNFKLDGNLDIKSNTYEIQLMNDAITAMRQTLRAFSKFVPRDLVSKLIRNGAEVKIGGKSKDVTIMFSDIVGFTTVTENYPPEKLMTHLSEYFNELSTIIMENKGTIDKYIGDAIMAFWGAPIADKKQAVNACRSALLIQKRLRELNRKWQSRGKPKLYTRIGIHSGSAIVGNLGSADRMNYTVIGDAVNLASRLEYANKLYDTRVVISEDTYKKVEDFILAKPIDIIRVRGRHQSVSVYELVAFKDTVTAGDSVLLPSQDTRENVEKFQRAFGLYLGHHWAECIKVCEEIDNRWGESRMTKTYIERCKYFQKHPPSKNWDGVYEEVKEKVEPKDDRRKK